MPATAPEAPSGRPACVPHPNQLHSPTHVLHFHAESPRGVSHPTRSLHRRGGPKTGQPTMPATKRDQQRRPRNRPRPDCADRCHSPVSPMSPREAETPQPPSRPRTAPTPTRTRASSVIFRSTIPSTLYTVTPASARDPPHVSHRATSCAFSASANSLAHATPTLAPAPGRIPDRRTRDRKAGHPAAPPAAPPAASVQHPAAATASLRCYGRATACNPALAPPPRPG